MATPRKHTEDESQAELASTRVSAPLARTLSWAFVFFLVAVPASQAVLELSRGEKPTFLRFDWKELTNRQYLATYETSLEKSSPLRSWVQSHLQLELTRWLSVGNHKVAIGHDGWLFYQSGIDYLAGPNFLSEDALAKRHKSAVDRDPQSTPHPDPRPALTAFIQGLRQNGVQVILLPVPDKAMVHPARLSRDATVYNNPGYVQFVAEMEKAGATVFNLAGHPQASYLKQDTHWRPEWMAAVARDLATQINKSAPPALPAPEIRRHTGDLVDLLALPKPQAAFPSEEVAALPLPAAAPNPESDVVLLGDSFTNIYSDPALGWGSNAGFAQHLAHALGRPLQVVALNGAGATGVRQEFLRSDQARRLYTKKFLIYEFTIHDLSNADWRPIPFPAQLPPPPPEPVITKIEPKNEPAIEPKNDGTLRLTATLELLSPIPVPGVSPYRDCLAFATLRVTKVLSGDYKQPVVLAAFHVMQDNVLTASSNLKPGDQIQMELVLMKKAPVLFSAMQRSDTTDDFEHSPYLVLNFKKQ